MSTRRAGGALFFTSALCALTACGPKLEPCNLAGDLQSGPQVCPDRASVDFGDQSIVLGRSARSSLLLRNGGTRALLISEVALALPPAVQATASWESAPASSRTGPVTVAAGRDVSLTFTFAPDAAGVVEGRLLVRSDAENTPELAVPVWGCGRETSQPANTCARP